MISLTCWLSGGDAIRMLWEHPSLRTSAVRQAALRATIWTEEPHSDDEAAGWRMIEF